MARERMAQSREEQLLSVQREAEIQQILQRERREMEIRQELQREDEEALRRQRASRQERARGQPVQIQRNNLGNHLQEQTRTRASSYRDQLNQMQDQRRSGC